MPRPGLPGGTRTSLTRLLPWRWRPTGGRGHGDRTDRQSGTLTTRLVGQISSALFLLCGVLVIGAGAFVAFPPGADRFGLIVLGVATIMSGVVIGVVPWERWRRSASLWLVPVAFTLIVLHGLFSADDGFVYGLFYVVVFVWLGLGHRPGTSIKFLPLFAVVYEVPLLAVRGTHGSVGPASAVVRRSRPSS
jgi:hypothetical protein